MIPSAGRVNDTGGLATWRLYSALVVFVVEVPPVAGLVAPLGGAVEPLVCAPKAVQSARVGRIGVVDGAVREHERAHARPLARVGGDVSAGHGRALGSAFGCRPRGYLGNRPRRRAPVVVFGASFALLLVGDRDVEVEVEVAAER